MEIPHSVHSRQRARSGPTSPTVSPSHRLRGAPQGCLRRLGVRTLEAVVLTCFHDDRVERGNSDAACTQQDNAQARDAAVGCLLGDRALNSVDEGL
ncbi:hypothetical protein CWN80_05200 [Janibacter hoylei PVAS-1]|uniref:Uncharacterized protein n=1 Tax=Janibacter hoylei PVAS-1 TaxID=1210046 RepID=A0A444B720_9MICO|nr:hypothetical protein CWN80_05200 [Janibacter hoylei PVAS-1]